MTEAQKLAEERGCSLATAYRILRADRPAPSLPPVYPNPHRNTLVSETYHLIYTEKLPYLTAARRVLETASPEILPLASGEKRPVTPRRLADWTRPK